MAFAFVAGYWDRGSAPIRHESIYDRSLGVRPGRSPLGPSYAVMMVPGTVLMLAIPEGASGSEALGST